MKSSLENLNVLYQDNHIIIVNKRPGDIVQGDKTGDTPLSEIVKQYLKKEFSKSGNVYLGVTHRLDRVTSGIVVFAKTDKALTRLNKMFKEKSVKKTYWAIVAKGLKNDSMRLENYLLRNPQQNKSYAYDREVKDSKLAILNFKIIAKLDNYDLLEVDLETGRHHQIRSQLAHLGFPIKGDVKYGFKRANQDLSIDLHARKIEFQHPVSKELISIEADTPNQPIWNSIK